MDPNYSLTASNFLLGFPLGPNPFGRVKARESVATDGDQPLEVQC